MMRGGRHLRRGDTACAIKRRENLAQPDHGAADTWLAFHDSNPVALFSQVQRRLQPGDSAPDYQSIRF
jgi:hypothetical protein